MLLKIMLADKTLEFDSKENPIAIILEGSEQETVAKMKKGQQLLLAAPSGLMASKSAELWYWARNGWKSVKEVASASVPIIGEGNGN